ncbi:hypothetical protein VX037_18750 [Gordonia sp. Z-3]|uniref:hypothetical protein n=1 Tax=Gordonia sp. Z-3 TaxID=3115408 RepID=UPI002E28F71B|nr:hypothetical protein [Gordonia sp. Z-3]MED5803067.1 hypothetical protein [Gordonia sp. Z-3]
MRNGDEQSTVVLFVHGTGTRSDAHNRNVRSVREAFEEHDLPGTLQSLYWGQHLGASLAFDGSSIPRFDETTDSKGSTDENNLRREAYWETLAWDPFHQLRARLSEPELRVRIGEESPGEGSLRRVLDYEPSAELKATEIGSFIVEAIDFVRRPTTFALAARRVEYKPLVEIFARAVVGRSLYDLIDRGISLPALDTRQEYSEKIISELDASTLAPLEWIAAPFVTYKMRNRGTVTRNATPFIGDIARFVKDPHPFRESLHHRLNEIDSPNVILMGHSLGGVIAVDLMLNSPSNKVSGVITVGSQPGILREFGVLAIQDERIFEDVPWLNIYHSRDYLSYLAAPIFSGMVEDFKISDWQPFPSCHSSYLRKDQREMWAHIRGFIQKATTS